MRPLDALRLFRLLLHKNSKNLNRRVETKPVSTLPALEAGDADAGLVTLVSIFPQL